MYACHACIHLQVCVNNIEDVHSLWICGVSQITGREGAQSKPTLIAMVGPFCLPENMSSYYLGPNLMFNPILCVGLLNKNFSPIITKAKFQ
jgi:hypothetical protein